MPTVRAQVVRHRQRWNVLLDEIGDMPLQPRSKPSASTLQEGSFEPVGSDTTVKVDWYAC